MTPASSTRGNPDIVFPPNAGKKAIPFSRPGVGWNGSAKIDSWLEIPNSNSYILVASGGDLAWIQIPEGNLSVLAASGGEIEWLETKDCNASPTP